MGEEGRERLLTGFVGADSSDRPNPGGVAGGDGQHFEMSRWSIPKPCNLD